MSHRTSFCFTSPTVGVCDMFCTYQRPPAATVLDVAGLRGDGAGRRARLWGGSWETDPHEAGRASSWSQQTLTRPHSLGRVAAHEGAASVTPEPLLRGGLPIRPGLPCEGSRTFSAALVSASG